MNSNQVMSAMGNPLDGLGIPGWYGDLNPTGKVTTAWDYWQNCYYPSVIRESYPVYIQERAKDKGKTAFEIIKALQDKKFLKLDKVSDFIDAMDTLINIV